MILFLDDEAERTLKATLGIHLAAGSLSAAGESCRVIDLFCGLSRAQLSCYAADAELIVVHSNGVRLAQLQAQLAELRSLAPAAQILLVGWLDGALAQVPLQRWLTWVTGVYASGAREELTPFLKGIREGALHLSGERRLWGFDAAGIPLPAVPCLTSGYAWQVRPLVWEKLVCDSVCRKCTYASCLVDAYLSPRAVSAQGAFLRQALTRLSEAGARYVALEDQTTPASFQKLWLLGDLAANFPNLRWIIRVDGARLLKNPELIPALGRIPLAGLTLLMPAYGVGPRADLGLALEPSEEHLLCQVRQSVGDRTFIYVAAYTGYPSDSVQGLREMHQAAGHLFDEGVLDHFTIGQAFIEKSSPIAMAGGYRFPFPGRKGVFGLPYWESDFADSTTISAEVRELSQRWASRSPWFQAYPSLDDLVSVIELGVGLEEVRQSLRAPLDSQHALCSRVAAERTAFAARYLEGC